MESNKVSLELGDIFYSKKEAIVIPRSTTGTFSDTIKNGLQEFLNIGNLDDLPYRVLGSLDVTRYDAYDKANDNFDRTVNVLYATCVDNNMSTYEAIKEIAAGIAKFSQNNPTVRNIATPLIGTGAGRLDHFEVYKSGIIFLRKKIFN